MLRIANLKSPLDSDLSRPAALVARALHLPENQITRARIAKKSVDARDKGDVHLVLSLDFEARDASPDSLRPPRGAQLSEVKQARWSPPAPRALAHRPVVAGRGPAGLFAALALARAGLRPIVLERGRDVEARARDVQAFWTGGPLDPSSNVQFGEGGAGAFSDGKLNTGISDPRCLFVLHTLYEHGAPEEILYQAKPHVGTDRLPDVVKSIREEIVSLGGEVLFETRLDGLISEGGRIRGVRAGGAQWEVEDLILAVGHSARDTFEMLCEHPIAMQPKPFSIGARIEHPQRLIDASQYGASAGHPALGAADYKLSVKARGGRGVYTFCMCPGGTVVAAASEEGMVATNGMSRFARDGANANSALLVSVDPSDYEDAHPLSGVAFQRKWERAAFAAGGGDYRAPAQLVGDFLKDQPSSGPGSVRPTYLPGTRFGTLNTCLPRFALEAMREGIVLMDRRLKGFSRPDAVLTGVETRSSSPVRILRDARCQATLRGLYPAGEGAGYAGGILSAAVDGLRCAEALMREDGDD